MEKIPTPGCCEGVQRPLCSALSFAREWCILQTRSWELRNHSIMPVHDAVQGHVRVCRRQTCAFSGSYEAASAMSDPRNYRSRPIRAQALFQKLMLCDDQPKKYIQGFNEQMQSCESWNVVFTHRCMLATLPRITKSGAACLHTIVVSRIISKSKPSWQQPLTHNRHQHIRSHCEGRMTYHACMRMQRQREEFQQHSQICLPSHLGMLLCMLLISISSNICSGRLTDTYLKRNQSKCRSCPVPHKS